jgi:valyl-tRNA synthetase
MASPGRDIKLSEERVKGYRNFLNKLWNANNFLILNKCSFNNIKKTPKSNINLNKWIYSELLETKKIVEKNVKDYRFDEASREIYQFVWHSYCDLYLELSKTILYSDNKKNVKEIKKMASYVFKEILILLHPFIPFITEEIWLKNKLDNSSKDYLMLANWPDGKIRKDKDTKDVENLIYIISEIRSFKNELNISPGSFIDVSLSKIDRKKRDFFKKNETVLKKLGRISNFLNKDIDKPSALVVIKGNVLKLYFEESIDLNLIKENLLNKQSKYQAEMDKIQSRLKNKDFVKRAPKHIVEQEKTNYNILQNDIKKISLTVKSL